MASARMTAKRQITLPHALCEQMGLKRGDRLALEKRVVDGEELWVLRRAPIAGNGLPPPDFSWFGCLRRYAKGKSHSMDAIRKSIAKAKKRGTI
ncbi:MAG: AbrB/MazE/SpoVT family DNA-binding domain-containing protein [Planctomycetes bacterium]|nr:AbrB/MazE/SpoVT family DNA-binding domain-containing protein [Planctomycetota bacterium]